MSEIRIILDLDDVLVDFVGGVCKLLGITKQDLEKHWTPGNWDIVPSLSKAIGMLDTFKEKQFWEAINDGGEQFWLELEELPWMNDLDQLVIDSTDDWHIVSSPSYSPCSYAGKVKWLKNWYGNQFDRFAITPHKEIFACENVILIDDRQENISKFRKAGGEGILFPTRGNNLYSFSDNPLKYVTPILKGMIDAPKVQ